MAAGAAFLCVVPRRLAAWRLAAYLIAFVALRDAMTPLGIWTIGPTGALRFTFDAVLDGELLVLRNGEVAPFSDLQQRLNRKTVTRAMLTKYPVHVRFYDALEIGGEDLRGLSFTARRQRLEAWHREHGPAHSDLSEVLRFASKEELKARWQATNSTTAASVVVRPV